MITGSQIRAARALLRWSAKELGEKSNVSLNTVQRLESVDDVPSTSAKTINNVQTALENAGVKFINNGVALSNE